METQREHLAMAAVPVQRWGELYDRNTALKNGTVFKDLDLPFFAAETCSGPALSPEPSGRQEEMTQGELLLEIQKISFVLDDLRLYLDTHPEDPEGIPAFLTVLQKRKKMTEDFAARFYPLTQDCMDKCCGGEIPPSFFCWQEGPAPWEGGAA